MKDLLRALWQYFLPAGRAMGQGPSNSQSDGQPDEVTEKNCEDLLYTPLYDGTIECPITKKKYLPLGILDDIITVQNVEASIKDLNCRGCTPSKKVISESRKILAISVLIQRTEALLGLLAKGLTDKSLPLARKERGKKILISLGCKGQEFNLDEWGGYDIDRFLEKQWLLQAPVFDTKGGHFKIGHDCALPLEESMRVIGSTDFSRVYKAKIHPSHFEHHQDFQVSV